MRHRESLVAWLCMTLIFGSPVIGFVLGQATNSIGLGFLGFHGSLGTGFALLFAVPAASVIVKNKKERKK